MLYKNLFRLICQRFSLRLFFMLNIFTINPLSTNVGRGNNHKWVNWKDAEARRRGACWRKVTLYFSDFLALKGL